MNFDSFKIKDVNKEAKLPKIQAQNNRIIL